MQICEEKYCTACEACINICPQGCVALVEKYGGALYPEIDEVRCVRCGRCQAVCPSLNSAPTLHTPLKCYAAWRTDLVARAKSASGGIATIMAEYVLKQGGALYGTRYDAQLSPVVSACEDPAELSAFQGSKYVHSKIGATTFQKIYHRLRKEEGPVLFVGTPCQIAGLKAYISSRSTGYNALTEKQMDQLITVDLLCHGVPPSRYLQEEIASLKNKHGWANISDVRFRCNGAQDFHFTVWDGDRLLYDRFAHENLYFAAFMYGITLRENCYDCRYARPERIGDLTLGDFIGLGQSLPFDHDSNNVSFVSVNSARGEAFWKTLLDNRSDLEIYGREYSERLVYPYALRRPFPRHKKQPAFSSLCRQKGYWYAIDKVLSFKVLRSRMWRRLRRVPLLGALINKIM